VRGFEGEGIEGLRVGVLGCSAFSFLGFGFSDELEFEESAFDFVEFDFNFEELRFDFEEFDFKLEEEEEEEEEEVAFALWDLAELSFEEDEEFEELALCDFDFFLRLCTSESELSEALTDFEALCFLAFDFFDLDLVSSSL